MKSHGAPTFSELTTFRVGGPVGSFMQVHSAEALADAVANADKEGTPVLVIGGGSNILAGDKGFDGLVIQDARYEITQLEEDSCGGATVKVSAGTPWDTFVHYAIDHEWMGVEALSGIPGSVGAAPVQNIGAYGQEVSESLASVHVFDRLTKQNRTLAAADLKLAYRDSVLKQSRLNPIIGGGRTWGPSGRWIVLEAQFHMRLASLSAPIRYQELAGHLGVKVGQRAPSIDVREAVLELRQRKGMVLDHSDHDTWSAGSFFTNPILAEDEAAHLPEDAPRFPVENHQLNNNINTENPIVEGFVKTSAAWLIAGAGFEKGFGLDKHAKATLSRKHILALTNRGHASATDILQLAETIQQKVKDQYGILLEPEPVLVGCSL